MVNGLKILYIDIKTIERFKKQIFINKDDRLQK